MVQVQVPLMDAAPSWHAQRHSCLWHPVPPGHSFCHADRAIIFPCTELLNLSSGLVSLEHVYFQPFAPHVPERLGRFHKGDRQRFMRSCLLPLLWAASLPAAAISAKEGLATAKGLPRVQLGGIPDPFPGLFSDCSHLRQKRLMDASTLP